MSTQSDGRLRRIDELEKLFKASTEGKWETRDVQLREDRSGYATVEVEGKALLDSMNADVAEIKRDDDGACQWTDEVGRANAAFAAEAHNEMPWLIQSLREFVNYERHTKACAESLQKDLDLVIPRKYPGLDQLPDATLAIRVSILIVDVLVMRRLVDDNAREFAALRSQVESIRDRLHRTEEANRSAHSELLASIKSEANSIRAESKTRELLAELLAAIPVDGEKKSDLILRVEAHLATQAKQAEPEAGEDDETRLIVEAREKVFEAMAVHDAREHAGRECSTSRVGAIAFLAHSVGMREAHVPQFADILSGYNHPAHAGATPEPATGG